MQRPLRFAKRRQAVMSTITSPPSGDATRAGCRAIRAAVAAHRRNVDAADRGMNGWTADAGKQGAAAQSQLQRIRQRLARLLAATSDEDDGLTGELRPRAERHRPALRVVHPDD